MRAAGVRAAGVRAAAYCQEFGDDINGACMLILRFAVAVTAAAIALTACGGSPKPSPASSSAVAQTSPAAPVPGQKPSREFVIGKWGTNGDCALAVDLRADGTSDGPFGNWRYDDGVISFVDEPDFKVSVTVIDPNTMKSVGNQDKPATMTRCP